MQIKEFARQASLPAKTTRYHEEIGLLLQLRRLENGYRTYDGSDISRAKLVACARTLDFSLVDIQAPGSFDSFRFSDKITLPATR
ncbi:MAG: MerR family transcriptional regulator [Chloroflexi bacterium]|jgi:DNA-binding transcriptional MerR regulator|nr:MerR family transcriptional regulator [Chloroflexota bacterium]